MKSLREKYNKDAIPALKEKFGYGNVLAVPRIIKVVVNVGVGKINKETEKIEEIAKALMEITGQKPVKTKSHTAIAGFKIRQGLEIGMKVTLRGKRMWQFLERLLNATLPRTRDFQGLNKSSVDQSGNLNIGINEHTTFPEILAEKVKNIFSLQVTIVTSAKNRQEGTELFKKMGFPLK